jgi:hypothetical protein
MHYIRTYQGGSEEKEKKKKEWSKRTTSRLQRAMSGLVRQLDNCQIGLILFTSWSAVGPYSILGPQHLSIIA